MPDDGQRFASGNLLLLCGAWVAALIVYSPVLGAGWISDDYDYVLNDPRLDHLELFWPSHWSDPPPALKDSPDGTSFLPGYQNSLLSDRYLWRLSFALERRVAGLSARTSHTINLLLHFACIGALFWALGCVLKLYFPEQKAEPGIWQLLPGLAALIFAVHPWAAEPVCYVGARNASLGTLFVLLGLGFWCGVLQTGSRRAQILQWIAAAACALAAFGSKENFITAPAGYVLVTWPIYARRFANWRWQRVLSAILGTLFILFILAYLGIRFSDRAAGLWAQTGVRGFKYLFEIQSPLVLMTLADQIPVARLSFEANHPNWPLWACALALALNAGLIGFSLIMGRRWPILLGLTWFYLHLLPTNSILPRPDFLAARNVYLPMAGIATLGAGALLGIWQWYLRANSAENKIRRLFGLPQFATLAAALLVLFWSYTARDWSQGFVTPKLLWARSAKIAPDHESVRLNLACAILNETPGDKKRQFTDVEREVQLALAAEKSPTMSYYSERPRQVQHALALRLLALLRIAAGDGTNAAHLYRESWTLHPTVSAWMGWAQTSLDNNLSSDVADAISEGQKRWPDAWWPLAMHGLYRARGIVDPENLAPEILHDLEAAEHAPDATQPDLRSLQLCALFQLVQASAARPRAVQLLERLIKLGLSPDDQRRLVPLLQPGSSVKVIRTEAQGRMAALSQR